jgi:phosphatidylinositol phospholipase C gamma-1
MAMMGVPNGNPLPSFITEMEQIISQLERGTVVTKFYPRKRPERKTLMIRRETRQVVWARTAATRTFESAGMYDLNSQSQVRERINSDSSPPFV